MFEPVKDLGTLLVQPRIDLLPLLDLGEAVALPDGVVVGEAVIAASHDVQGGEVATRELHRAEEHVADVGAEHGVLPLGDLARQAHQDLLDGLGVDHVLEEKEFILEHGTLMVFRVLHSL